MTKVTLKQAWDTLGEQQREASRRLREQRDRDAREFLGIDESWDDLEREALSSEEFDEVVKYLNETGQASA